MTPQYAPHWLLCVLQLSEDCCRCPACSLPVCGAQCARSHPTQPECGVFARHRDKVTSWTLELETKVHPKIRNHGEGPY